MREKTLSSFLTSNGLGNVAVPELSNGISGVNDAALLKSYDL